MELNDDQRVMRLMSRRTLLAGGGLSLGMFLIGCAHPRSDPSVVPRMTIVSVDGHVIVPTPGATEGTAKAATTTTGPVVFIDPGHGGVDSGAIGTTNDGQDVDEKTVTLDLALRTATKLRSAGYQVVLSRTSDELPGLLATDLTPDGEALTPQGVLNDLQRRIDRANASGAKLFLSIHLNANDDPSVTGTETFYDSTRSFATENSLFAQSVQQHLIAALRANGYTTPDLGVIDDTTIEGNSLGVLPDIYNHLVLLGPGVSGQLRPTLMPGALSESLFLSNPDEATAATEPEMQDLIAGAYAAAISQVVPLKS